MRSATVRSLASLRVRDVTTHADNARHFPDLASALAAFDSWQARHGIQESVRHDTNRVLNSNR